MGLRRAGGNHRKTIKDYTYYYQKLLLLRPFFKSRPLIDRVYYHVIYTYIIIIITSQIIRVSLRYIDEIIHAPLRHQIEQTRLHLPSTQRHFHRFQNLRHVFLGALLPVFHDRSNDHVRQPLVETSLRFHIFQEQVPSVDVYVTVSTDVFGEFGIPER